MTARPAYLAAAMLTALAASFLAGRWSAPTKTLEVTKQHEQAREHTNEVAKADTTTATKKIEGKFENVTVRRFRADGSLSSIRSSEAGTRTSTATQAQSVEIKWKDREKEVIREVTVERIVEGPRPRWLVSAFGGISWLASERYYGVQAMRNVIGPVEAGVWVGNKGAGILVGIRF